MKVSSKRTILTTFLCALCVVLFAATMLLVDVMPDNSHAEEEFSPDIVVTTAKDLKQAVLDAPVGSNYKIRLGADIVLGTVEDQVGDEKWGLRTWNKDLTIDLNGHTMKREGGYWVINVSSKNAKLELIDTSPEKTGTITNDTFNDVLIYNYGELITSVNFTSGTSHFTGYTISYAIIESKTSPTRAEVDNGTYETNWKKPSVTIKDGVFKGAKDYALISLIDSDLTIENGTFLRDEKNTNDCAIFKADSFHWVSETNKNPTLAHSEENKPQLKADALNDLKKYFDAYKPYRGCNVSIKGGDFTGTKGNGGKPESIIINDKIQYEIPAFVGNMTYEVENETIDHKISIEGGSWGVDLTPYVAPGKWMRRFDPSIDEGPAGDYYIVDDVEEDAVASSVSVGNSEKKFSNFEAAWAYAMTLSGDRTVNVISDVMTTQLDMYDALSGNVILDLNGHVLTVDCKDKAAVKMNGSSSNNVTLTIKDGTAEQKGEFVLNMPSGANPSYARGIDITSTNKFFVLESGTIRQTGYFPNERVYTDPEGGNGSQNQAQSIFHIGEFAKKIDYAIVTIKGGNILSEIYYGTEDDHGALTSSKSLVTWDDGYATKPYKNINFQIAEDDTYGYSVQNKSTKFVFDITEYVNGGRTSIFSWDLKDKENKFWGDVGNEFEGLDCVSAGVSKYAFTHLDKSDNYLANGKRYSELSDALGAKTGDNYTVTLLRNIEITENVIIDGITLDLDENMGFTMTLGEGGSLTLKNGAALRNGELVGNVTIEGNAVMASTVSGDVTVTSGVLTIPGGAYNGHFTVSDGASISITGGSFVGEEIPNVEQYFAFTLGAYIAAGQDYVDGTLYPVQIAPNSEAQKWFKTYKDSATFKIATTEEWNYFALYVSSGVENFTGKSVELTADLDFGNSPATVSYAKRRAVPSVFFPVGNQTYRFNGTFDGNGHTVEGINVTERNAALFGGTNGGAKINNVTVANSVFEGGSGYFDIYNTEKGWVFAAGVIAQGNQGHNSRESAAKGIKVENVKITQAENIGNIMGGGFIGQTWSNLFVEGIEIDGLTLDGNWKMGGIVGFTEAGVTVIGANVTNFESLRGAYVGAVTGHANGSGTYIEDCTIIANDNALIGTTYASGEDSDIIIEGSMTYVEADHIVGPDGSGYTGRSDESKTVIKFSTSVDEETGVHRTTVKLGKTKEEEKLTFADKDGEPLPEDQQPKPNEDGSYEFRAPLTGEERIGVSIGALKGTVQYAGADEYTMNVESFELYDEFGNLVDSSNYGEIIIQVTLKKSVYNVGEQFALITSYTILGTDAENFTLLPTGNQAFIDVTVQAANLTISVDQNGQLVYSGFVGNDDKNVLQGQLTLEKVDNGDGTYTVTPGGLTSENYNITFKSGIVPSSVYDAKGDNNIGLWVALGVIGALVAICGALAIVYAVRKGKRSE